MRMVRLGSPLQTILESDSHICVPAVLVDTGGASNRRPGTDEADGAEPPGIVAPSSQGLSKKGCFATGGRGTLPIGLRSVNSSNSRSGVETETGAMTFRLP